MPHQIVNSNIEDNIKVSVLGAAGGIGQSLSLLFKTQLHYSLPGNYNKSLQLSLYDVNEDAINGVAADLSHIDTPVSVTGHSPANNGIDDCLRGSNLVIIPAGMPRKPGMTRDDLFNINAKIIVELTDAIARNCDLSKVFVLIISNPVNSLVPVCYQRLLNNNSIAVHNSGIERRIFGITKLDIVRASTFLRELTDPNSLNMPFVPVIGGHSGETIIPLFSQNTLTQSLSQDQISNLIYRVQYGGDEIVKAKNGKGSATLSMAHAGFKCAQDFVNLIAGTVHEIETINFTPLLNFNHSPIAPGAEKLLNKIDQTPFFSIPITVNLNGTSSINYNIMNNINSVEANEMLPLCISKLKKNIVNGETFANSLTN